MKRKFDASKMAAKKAADRAYYGGHTWLIADDDCQDSQGRIYYTAKRPYRNEYVRVRCDRLMAIA